MATPCDGIQECRDGRDEACEDDKWMLIFVVSCLCVSTICFYQFLLRIKIPQWKCGILREFGQDTDDEAKNFVDCITLKGDDLVKLKV